MRGELVRMDLRLRRRVLLGTTLGAAAYTLLVVAAYPAFRNDAAMDALVRENRAAAAAFGITGSVTSAAGWLGANMYANVAPLLALLLAIGYGAAAIAGRDAEGGLGLLASLPLSRGRLLGEMALTLLLVSVAVPAATFAVCLSGPRFDLRPDWGNLAGATLGLTLLAFAFGALALFVGALTGSRGAALGVAGAAAAAAYLISSLAPVIGGFRSVRWLSPFSWAVGDGQLAAGIAPGEVAALAGLGVALVVAALAAFRRVDIH